MVVVGSAGEIAADDESLHPVCVFKVLQALGFTLRRAMGSPWPGTIQHLQGVRDHVHSVVRASVITFTALSVRTILAIDAGRE
jgi:hypothetical protein